MIVSSRGIVHEGNSGTEGEGMVVTEKYTVEYAQTSYLCNCGFSGVPSNWLPT